MAKKNKYTKRVNLLSPQIKLIMVGVFILGTMLTTAYLKKYQPSGFISKASNEQSPLLEENSAIRFLSTTDENGETGFGYLAASLDQNILTSGNTTIESWFNPDALSDEGSTIFFQKISQNSQHSLEISSKQIDDLSSELTFILTVPSMINGVCEIETLAAKTKILTETINQWHHVASQVQAGKMEIYFDGKKIGMLDGVNVSIECNPTSDFFVATQPSAASMTNFTYQGLLDDFRISTIARYENDFKPSAFDRVLPTDKYDILLLRFNEKFDGVNVEDESNYYQNVKTFGIINYVSP